MYLPRRVADPIETVEPVVQTPELSPRSVQGQRIAARRATPSVTDRLFGRSGIILAAVSVAATAGVVVLGSNGGAAVAVGAPTTTSAAPASSGLVTNTVTPATESIRALTADQLAAPAATATTSKKATSSKKATRTKKAPLALLSLTRLYTTGSLNVRDAAKTSGKLLGSVAAGRRISATSDVEGKYRKIEFEKGYGWILEASLSEAAPVEAAPVEAAGTTWGACSRGSSVEKRLRKDTVHIYRSVCALFPAVNSYGGWRSGGMPFHRNGRAVDIMLTPRAESALGRRVANYLIKHASDFKIDHIIFEQKIWTPRSPHWRHMADRGSVTANHFDHVHVAIRA